MARMRLFLLVALCSSALVACGGDDASEGDSGAAGGDPEAFCAYLEELGELDETLDPDSEESLAVLAELRRRAPAAVSDSVETLTDAMAELAEFEDGDIEAFGAAMMIMFDPEFLAAMEELEQYMVDVCGLDPDLFGGSSDFEPIEFDGDLDFDWDSDGFQGADIDLDEFGDYLRDNHGDEGWHGQMNSRFVFGSVVGVGGDFDADEAMAACEAVDAFLADQGVEATVEVSVDQTGEVLAERLDGRCVPG